MGGALCVWVLALSGRPVERSPAEQVDVDVIDGLAAVMARVDHQAIAFGQAIGAGNLRGGPEQMAKYGAVTFTDLVHRHEMFARRHQHMHRRLRVDIGEGVALLVLVDGCGGDASFDDLAEEATHNGSSVQDAQLVWSSRIFQPRGLLRHTSEKMPSSLVASPRVVRAR